MSTGQCCGKRHDTSMSLNPLFSTKKTALEVTDSGTTGSSTQDRANVKHGYTPNPWGPSKKDGTIEDVGDESEVEVGDVFDDPKHVCSYAHRPNGSTVGCTYQSISDDVLT